MPSRLLTITARDLEPRIPRLGSRQRLPIADEAPPGVDLTLFHLGPAAVRTVQDHPNVTRLLMPKVSPMS